MKHYKTTKGAMRRQKRIMIIAGPDGAGKTTFAREDLPRDVGFPDFINVDLIAAGLSPFAPETVTLRAAPLSSLMKFLADENVERPVVETLRGDGHDVLALSEIRSGLLDDAVLERANREGRILITNDKDFGELVFLRNHSDAVQFRKEHCQAQHLRSFVHAQTEHMSGRFVVLSETRARLRSLK